MACGIPVICSNTSSLPEVAGDAALLVDPAESATSCQVCLPPAVIAFDSQACLCYHFIKNVSMKLAGGVMIRTQIQLKEAQYRSLKELAAHQHTSVFMNVNRKGDHRDNRKGTHPCCQVQVMFRAENHL